MTVKIFSFVIILFLGFNGYSQSPSLEETKVWIKEKLEMYPMQSTEDYSTTVSVEFRDCLMVYHYELNFRGTVLITEYQIPMKSIHPITFNTTEVKNSLGLIIRTENGDKVIRVVSNADPKEEMTSTVTLWISNEAVKYDLHNRLKKAFLNGKESCGGKIVEEKF